MEKKIAVIVRERQSEAIRMSVGLTVLDDKVEVFLMEPLKNDPATLSELDGAVEFGMKFYCLYPDSRFEDIGIEELAERILHYDHVIPY